MFIAMAHIYYRDKFICYDNLTVCALYRLLVSERDAEIIQTVSSKFVPKNPRLCSSCGIILGFSNKFLFSQIFGKHAKAA
jgi:hypothetical protein